MQQCNLRLIGIGQSFGKPDATQGFLGQVFDRHENPPNVAGRVEQP
jgi:hypothetical protein